jgi:chromosome segregation ATPase
MKRNTTFLIVAILLIVFVCPGFILISSSEYYTSLLGPSSNNSLEHEQINTMQNEFRSMHFAADTFDIDIDMDEFDEEMKDLRKELGKLKSYKFEFDFDNEEFTAGMEELKKELSELDFEELQFEFDNEKFKKSMALLKEELKEHKFSFDFDMENFKLDMEGLKEELKDLEFDLKDLDIELEKLDKFIDAMKEELESDGLIDNKDDDINLELNSDQMLINGDLVSDELFNKYKDMYEEHLGRKLDDDHNLIIR